HLEILPRIVEKGHTLGIHCYSHYLKGLYWDANSFFTDFMKAQEVIYQIRRLIHMYPVCRGEVVLRMIWPSHWMADMMS
ncbi:MAG: hypothetical protein IKN38_09995, partial [Clostridia bacterium]|nr:hypothetical protein [Clostridia bacterium]